MFTLPPLPYEPDALEPYISRNTMEYHYHKHHQGYVDTLNKLTQNTPFAAMELEAIIKQTANDSQNAAIFNNAAQIWNHTFFWNSMTPGDRQPDEKRLQSIKRDFGSYDDFCTAFKQAATGQFGSGWAWLIEAPDGKLSILKTANADTPLAHGLKPLLTCDVWEHAYYLDYQNRRADFVENFLRHLVKWQ